MPENMGRYRQRRLKGVQLRRCLPLGESLPLLMRDLTLGRSRDRELPVFNL